MPTITGKRLVGRIAQSTQTRPLEVKPVIEQFLNVVVSELSKGSRVEFCDFGVFEVRILTAARARNPEALESVQVPAGRCVRFKTGRIMRWKLSYDLMKNLK